MTRASQGSIAKILHPPSRFLRSAQLERDFNDPEVFSGYVATDFALSCLNRLGEGLGAGSAQRAWRLTGDYGSGKSSFALLLAHWFAGHDSTLPKQVRSATGAPRRNREFVPALVTCTKQPLTTSIMKALQGALAEAGRIPNKAKLVGEIEDLLLVPSDVTDDRVLELVLRINSSVIAGESRNGLLLIIDELGKFLEFAANNPERQDVFLLQRLAEVASRSGKQPLFVVCLLHQGFGEYANHLSQSAQREWEKVAGRFEEIIFDQPLEQIAQLISSALDVRTELIPRAKISCVKHAMRTAAALRWFGPAPATKLIEIAPELYPLHPMVLPVLIRTFRRFAQRERSLFSFLMSNEPFGLRAFCEKLLVESEPYLLHDFYDYVRMNFGHRLAVQSYRSHWNLIDSIIESFATDDELQHRILKTVGILNLLSDEDLLASEDAIVCAMGAHDVVSERRVLAALEQLHRVKRILYQRGRAGGFRLWPHTSVDLQKAYEASGRVVISADRVAASIDDHLEVRPLVARRHYIETGNLRHFEVRYVRVAELARMLEDAGDGADGVIVIPLCETVAEQSVALDFAKLAELKKRQCWLVGVPQPLNALASLVQEVQRWEWIGRNTLELNADRFAREEVSRQTQIARTQLGKRLQSFVGLKQFATQTSLQWFHKARPLRLADGRELMSELSDIFDRTYSEAPCIQNELVNRRVLSGAAAGARMRLIERMFTDSTSPLLGMNPAKKPPEMSMYLSVLKESGLHRRYGEYWRIAEPHHRADNARILPVMHRIRDIVQKQPDRRVNVASLFEELRKPPYGVRDGIIPLLLAAFAVAHDRDIAFYKDGTFLREMNGQSMLVLTKAPERFEIQYCKIAGVRAALFEKLITALKLERSNDRKVELLDVVKPLCVFVAQLPAYVLNTKRLSGTALGVREAILAAREPATLVFSALPIACGFESVSSNLTANGNVPAFVRALRMALDELRATYPELQQRLRERLREAFKLAGEFQQFRTALAARAEHVLLTITEPKLRTFCLRLMDDSLLESDWLESLGSYLALKPPSKWHDAEEDVFSVQLAELASRFQRVEAISFAGGNAPKGTTGVRLAITQLNGIEHEEVVHFTLDEEHHLRGLQKRFEALLAGDKRLGLAAASRAIWKSLGNGGKTPHD